MHCMIPIFACFSSHKSIYFEVGGMRRLRSAVEWQRSDDCRAGPEIGGGFCLRFTFTAAGRGLLKSVPVFCVAAALFISLRHGGHGVFGGGTVLWWGCSVFCGESSGIKASIFHFDNKVGIRRDGITCGGEISIGIA